VCVCVCVCEREREREREREKYIARAALDTPPAPTRGMQEGKVLRATQMHSN
jgi:hypothetical protein